MLLTMQLLPTTPQTKAGILKQITPIMKRLTDICRIVPDVQLVFMYITNNQIKFEQLYRL